MTLHNQQDTLAGDSQPCLGCGRLYTPKVLTAYAREFYEDMCGRCIFNIIDGVSLGSFEEDGE